MKQNRPLQHRQFHRYCTQCGWGLSRGAWHASVYCKRCGSRLAKGSGPSHAASEEVVDIIPARQSRKHSNRNPVSWNAGSMPQSNRAMSMMDGRSSFEKRVSKVKDFVSENPYTSAVIGAGVGGMAIAAGSALATVGVSVAAIGGTIASVSGILGLLAAVGAIGAPIVDRFTSAPPDGRNLSYVLQGMLPTRSGQDDSSKGVALGFTMVVVGTLVGAAVSITGALISALGAALGVAGTVIIGVSALVAAARSAQLCREHRQEIRQLLACIRAKLPGAKSVKIQLSPSQMLDVHPLDLSKPLQRAKNNS